jgi:serine/threonine protein kinase
MWDRSVDMYCPMLGDIWSVGIMLLAALTGEIFISSAVESCEEFRFVVAGRLGELINSRSPIALSVEVVDLLQNILKQDPFERLSIAEINNHPWMQQQPLG